MIRSFKCRDTQSMYYGTRVKRFANIESAAMRKLAILNRARVLEDLRIPPANRLEALAGNRKGQHSIRINDQWRLCFKFHAGQVDDVEIVDYHWPDWRLTCVKFPTHTPAKFCIKNF